jgi:hypothetical protein
MDILAQAVAIVRNASRLVSLEDAMLEAQEEMEEHIAVVAAEAEDRAMEKLAAICIGNMYD